MKMHFKNPYSTHSIIVKWVLTGWYYKDMLIFGNVCDTLFVLVEIEFSTV